MICPAAHPAVGELCVKTFPHRRHKAERPRNHPTYRATDVWTWGPHEPWDGPPEFSGLNDDKEQH